ncbi:carbohydrate ABC transporter permease [Halalkalibacterium halodurans]|uniref:carbohydrate ABC transporter permease n=1 Tax=Halalkalibacterium halodurans TaxID=86665 RepID=UPI002E1EBDDC|nr:carbohydrate ABC transporter permease [Halalkalibacterium halodurans]MED4087209.1 carbohydrate ABC transporter permease [Halalkalibacterium halodurans]MED4106375.1 carbohydrate ABC transporter permease [Halalkalibacterium halodurans]MED4110851.1 carbohydrate ABC transporter permease [Halalkalibacterium halodurans]MED4151016.1 carbohydrate ABC transporter permease [Halalkalibacterium halodurans]
MKKKSGASFYFFLIVFVFLVMFPFIWVFLTSIKPPREIFASFAWFSAEPTFQSYVNAVNNRPLFTYMMNSFVISSLTTLIAIACASLAAYALTRLPIKGKGLILGTVLAASMFPQIAIITPIYSFITDLGLRNSSFGLVIPYITISLPLAIWILATFFKKIPFELEESAKLDGATPFQTFRKIIFPLAAPGVFTTAILVFIAAWNEYLFALTINTADRWRTVPVGLSLYESQYTIPWGDITAATVIVTVPIVIIVLLFQRRIVAGLTSGSVKE